MGGLSGSAYELRRLENVLAVGGSLLTVIQRYYGWKVESWKKIGLGREVG
jgi:hypothetical protein